MNDLRDWVGRAGAVLAVAVLAACGSADARQTAPPAEPAERIEPAAEEPVIEPWVPDVPALEREAPMEPPVLRRGPEHEALPPTLRERAPAVRHDRPPQMRVA